MPPNGFDALTDLTAPFATLCLLLEHIGQPLLNIKKICISYIFPEPRPTTFYGSRELNDGDLVRIFDLIGYSCPALESLTLFLNDVTSPINNNGSLMTLLVTSLRSPFLTRLVVNVDTYVKSDSGDEDSDSGDADGNPAKESWTILPMPQFFDPTSLDWEAAVTAWPQLSYLQYSVGS